MAHHRISQRSKRMGLTARKFNQKQAWPQSRNHASATELGKNHECTSFNTQATRQQEGKERLLDGTFTDACCYSVQPLVSIFVAEVEQLISFLAQPLLASVSLFTLTQYPNAVRAQRGPEGWVQKLMGWVLILLQNMFRVEQILRRSKFNVTDLHFDHYQSCQQHALMKDAILNIATCAHAQYCTRLGNANTTPILFQIEHLDRPRARERLKCRFKYRHCHRQLNTADQYSYSQILRNWPGCWAACDTIAKRQYQFELELIIST